MTFDTFPHPGPRSGGAGSHDSAAHSGHSQGAPPPIPQDPIGWAYDPSAHTDHDPHSRVDRLRAHDYADYADYTDYTGDPDSYDRDHGSDPRVGDPYDYGPDPRAGGPYDYDYGPDPRAEGFYDYGSDPYYSRRGPRRPRRHRKLRAAAKLIGILLYARRLESSYYGPDSYGPDPYGYGPGPMPREPYHGPYPPRSVPYPYGLRRKSKIAAGLLGIFLGAFGVHNFYLGHTGKAVVQLLMTMLSVGLLAPFSVMWGLIEGILILASRPGQSFWGVDARGVPLGA